MPAPNFLIKQAAPAAGANGDVYTVPAARRAVASSILIANTGAATTYRLFARKNGAAAAVGNAVAYDVDIPANKTDVLTIGGTLEAADVITGRSASGGVTFTLFGEETDVPAA